ncbi:hypothetical protein B712_0442 [Chlamydia psittaci NJ1]|nr:hypothetical protein B712_0442 [Chlamydia psittaci NJ1]
MSFFFRETRDVVSKVKRPLNFLGICIYRQKMYSITVLKNCIFCMAGKNSSMKSKYYENVL